MIKETYTMSDQDQGTPFCAFTIDEFVRAHKISRGKFQLMRKAGEGPEILMLGRRRLITVEAAAAWRKQMTRRDVR
jgi:hypothetical protein